MPALISPITYEEVTSAAVIGPRLSGFLGPDTCGTLSWPIRFAGVESTTGEELPRARAQRRQPTLGEEQGVAATLSGAVVTPEAPRISTVGWEHGEVERTAGLQGDQGVAVVAPEVGMPAWSAQTKVERHPSALPYVTDRVREVLDAILPLLELEARRNYVPVRKIEIRGYKDPEEGVSEVVVRQWVDLPGKAAMDYWERLGAAIEAWIDTLPPRLKSTALERVRVSVEWTMHGRAT